jgi:hypothetical protein
MTFLELCQAVRQECGIQGTGPAAVTNQVGIQKRVVDWVRDADLFVQSIHPDWDFLWAEFTANTILDSDAVARPSDLGMWDRTAFALDRGTVDGVPLNLIDFHDQRSQSNVRLSAKPYALAILPNYNLGLKVPANGIYEVYGNYWKSVTQLTTNTQLPLYPARFHRIIVAKAKMWFFEDIESDTQWKQAEKEYNEWLEQLESYALPQQQEANQSSPAQMAVRPE